MRHLGDKNEADRTLWWFYSTPLSDVQANKNKTKITEINSDGDETKMSVINVSNSKQLLSLPKTATKWLLSINANKKL